MTDTRRRRDRAAAALVFLGLAELGCATYSISKDRCPSYPEPPSAASPDSAVKVQYLGSGGYLVQRDEDVVLFGPVYSNPGLLEVLLDHQIRTDQGLVNRLLPKDAEKALAIVIGHSHYDHLLDTPYIATKKAKSAKVYGSATMAALIGSVVDSNRLVDVQTAAASRTFIPIGDHMRLWPIASRHSDQFRLKIGSFGLNLPVHSWRGEVSKGQEALPTKASAWAEGEVFAYVLDFLDSSQQPVFRVYYQDSGTDKPIGFPWAGEMPPDGKVIDVALICVGGDFVKLIEHPEGIIAATKPRFLILGHWEDFFVTQGEICRTGTVSAIPPPGSWFRTQPTKAFMKRAANALKANRQAGKPILPCPTASLFYFPIDPAGDAVVHKELERRRTSYDCRVPL